jgi:hypothetical protein
LFTARGTVRLPALVVNPREKGVTSFPGQPNVIQTSPNLLDWTPIGTNTPSSNTFTFTDSSAATNSQRFYRVLVPP